MEMKIRNTWRRTIGVAVLGATALTAQAANHREAPITALDHKADITDVFAFVSYGPDQEIGRTPEKVTLIMSVDPLLEPGNGPTLFPFDPDILYAIRVDNDRDAVEDVVFEFRFVSEFQLPGLYTAVAGVGTQGADSPVTGDLVVPPQIATFDNPGLNLRQTYSVKMKHRGASLDLGPAGGDPMFALPGNAGPRTIDYAGLFEQAIYDVENDVRVFAGTTDDAFWIDLGAAFDTANFRTLGSGVPGVLTAFEDSADMNFASDTVSGYAVNTIAIEVPIELLTRTRRIELPTSPAATVGVWATTSRQAVTVRRPVTDTRGGGSVSFGPWRQVQRMGNPLINELIIGIGSKDRFSMDEPRNDEQFADFFLNPPIATIVEALYGGALVVPVGPRLDLLPLVNYAPPIASEGSPGPIADLLRLNTGVPATPVADATRLGLIGGDAAGFPNGRRVFDDVVDVVLRVGVGGVLAGEFDGFNQDINGRLGDGVNVNDTDYRTSFPYVGLAPDGRNRRHVDPGEPGGGPVE